LVEVFVDDKCVGRATAGNFRQDLLDAEIGDGHYGFHIEPRVSRLNSVPIPATIKFDSRYSQHIQLTPHVDPSLESFAKVIETRVDAIMALTRERWERELKLIMRGDNPVRGCDDDAS